MIIESSVPTHPMGPQGRECGGCTACCTVQGIVELDLPEGVACPHECAAGCAIYAKRPQSCRDYECIWTKGFGDDEHRPDRLGVVIDEREFEGKRNFLVKELRPGAAQAAAAHLAVLHQLTKRQVYLYKGDHAVELAFGQPAGEARKARKKRQKLLEKKRREK